MKQALIDFGEKVMFYAQDKGENSKYPNKCRRWRFWFWLERKASHFQDFVLRY